MDKRTLKNIIIGYKLSGLSFADISNKLREEYNVDMSRQAICGLYNRATSKDNIKENYNTIINTTNICNYYVIGLNTKDIKEKLACNNCTLSLSKINKIIEDNGEYINIIEEHLVDKIKILLDNKCSMQQIINEISFNDIKPTSKKLDDLIFKASIKYINEKICGEINEILDITSDKKLAKSLYEIYKY